MNEEEQKAIEDLRGYLEWNDKNSFSRLPRDNHIETVLNLISKLQNEKEELEFQLLARERGEAEFETLVDQLKEKLEQEKEKNKKLNLENQALFESINCNDDNMLARRYQKLQKELDKKDKIINNAKDTIEYYLLGNMSLDDFNKREKELDKLKQTLEDENE